MHRFIIAALFLFCAPIFVSADGAKTTNSVSEIFNGLYGQKGWRCDANQVGNDGGAIAVQNGFFHLIESRCQSVDAHPILNGMATEFELVCLGEGAIYGRDAVVVKISTGMILALDGAATFWQECAPGTGMIDPFWGQSDMDIVDGPDDELQAVFHVSGAICRGVLDGPDSLITDACDLQKMAFTYLAKNGFLWNKSEQAFVRK